MAEHENSVVTKELRERSEAELKSLLGSKVEELQKARFRHALGQLRETHTLKLLKRDIARLETVLRDTSKVAAKETQA
ncbi:MAG: 50S ribosomal protein L29 [Deltaproteobacteria bacterium RIFOXYA12_FULL_58_15]|nr:MAG: 50S ribosomal protein L29 [Deltaproteobacteria bacterium RIFOXYA12_FULL_58_15]OGR15336.1 MAG: 50S ribosomal protein L29 [Deltaproteobacteria bacterium RIFOXYB12_FULL_58_9]